MMKRLAVLALVGGLAFTAACARDAPTRPAVVEEAPTPAAPSVTISAEALAVFSIALDDVTSRVLPALTDAATVEQLQEHLSALGSSLAADDVAGAQRAIALAQEVVSSQESSAEIGPVQLVLDQATLLFVAAD